MDSIKWKCKYWIVSFKKLGNFYLFHLVVDNYTKWKDED